MKQVVTRTARSGGKAWIAATSAGIIAAAALALLPGAGSASSTAAPATQPNLAETFTWKGSHAATVNGGMGTTVWWNPDVWDTRGDTANNAVASKGHGNHIDIHRSVDDLTKGSRVNNVYAIGGDGGPGVGVMHLDFEGILDARLRNPLLISAQRPGVVEFMATRFVTTGHWWEVAISPVDRVVGGDFTAVPSPSDQLNGNRGSGHNPPEDSINFVAMGRNDVPCITGWEFQTGVTKALGHTTTDSQGPAFAMSPAEKDELYRWRLEYYPDRIAAFADFNRDGVLDLLHSFPVEIPWQEVYIHLLGVAYQADHHPQNGDCGAFQGQLRELAWKDVSAGPLKYARTSAYPKEEGTAHLPQTTGWVGYDLRDTQRFGVVNGVSQPNADHFSKHFSMAFCSSAEVYGCKSPVSTKTLSFDLPAADATGAGHAQLVYDIRKDGLATLIVNGVPVGLLPNATTVPAASWEQWVHRSITVNPALLRAGTNVIVITMVGNIQMDRLQFELGHDATSSSPPLVLPPTLVPTPTAPPTQAPTPAPTLAPAPTVMALPGRLEAENYKVGGQGAGYSDTTAANEGGAYRTDGVDIEATSDAGGGHNVGWIESGEWLAYDVNVAATGLYDITARVASAGTGTKSLHVAVDGVNVSGPMSFAPTGGWQAWTNVTVSGVALTAGTHTLRIVMGAGLFNVNYLDATAGALSPPAPTPMPTPAPAPTLTPSDFAIEAGDTWKYFKGKAAPPGGWNTTAFNDAAWLSGPSGFGFGDGDDATLLSDMHKNYATLFIRKNFTVSDPAALAKLILTMDYDDGFVAYLNGVEVARANVIGTPTYTTLASGLHEASRGDSAPQPVAQFDLSGYRTLLVPGNNVLAISGHNESKFSSDFTLIPTLNGTR